MREWYMNVFDAAKRPGTLNGIIAAETSRA
jgi:hypothetical protein